ncbi:Lrp/AsnC family transcriptional regulator [Cryobacterium cryoconiti]|uniref:Lrp/AsnC family transcriptional regulator n=1 Tax=Cryobacterium cryoconiti TaxID=1259239 RepID=A0A4Y8JT73_9MICO|nr:Lrp/AsnC family transcriptional regulator [Cryobacterium cryoconiti]TFD26821.1 Lrp/AsnC family transcriptional regulator [Cryobacterium cryoconiti]
MHSLDKVDLQLLRALCADPRSTFVALAQQLHLSRNTVQARMSRLEESSAFLAFDRRINPVALGYPLTAFIEVHVQQKRLAQIVAELARIPEIVQAHGMSGSTDILVRVVCADADDLFRIDGTILACEGVERTETSLAMGELIPYRITPLLERSGRQGGAGPVASGSGPSLFPDAMIP